MSLAFSFRHLRANKDRVSAREYNKLVDLVAKLSRSLVSAGYIDSTGILIRRQPTTIPATIKIFEVQTAATGDGVYNCYEQTLDKTEWDDTAGDDKFDDKNNDSVEVLNLYENDPVSGYTPALGLYDRISAWQQVDDEGNKRWVGIPITPQIRIVFATEDAPATDADTTSVTCNLLLNNDVEAAGGELGNNIEVYGHCVGGTANWNAVAPRIANTDKLTAQNIQGVWVFTTEFIPVEDCDCYTAP